jgi:hypothetical protein
MAHGLSVACVRLCTRTDEARTSRPGPVGLESYARYETTCGHNKNGYDPVTKSSKSFKTTLARAGGRGQGQGK